MSRSNLWRRSVSTIELAAFSTVVMFCVAGVLFPAASAARPAAARPNVAVPGDVGPPTGPATKLKLLVLDPDGKPVGNASVYVRFYAESGGLLHHDKLAELDLKTNNDGTVKVPPVPQGKILIQVIAKGWHTFGKWYDVEKNQQSITIKLEAPPHWY
ncbi:MAG TPA: carboxypeptidase-like regulatory domain-containing protein [Candidatus Dormibacteraeota bacterium]|nr:carboxypeptidase-like regulatory domain-containing protein [Candidatus Dormibacteraeota bacterium]